MKPAVVPLLLVSAACGQNAPVLGDRDAQIAWVSKHGKEPTAYVAGLFEQHDVVIVGEHHLVRENVEFVAALIPVLDAAGVRILCSEFVRTAQAEEVDRLVTAETFDVKRGMALMRALPNPCWGHREYLEVLRAVHTVNRGKGPGEERFRVLGLESDWSQAERSRSRDRMAGMRASLAREKNMVDVMRREVLDRDRKALVHIGWAHSVPYHGLRMGTVLRKEYGDRVFPVTLHHDIEPSITARIEAVCGERGAVGFSIVGSPFAPMCVPEAMPFKMVPGATIGRLCEGWVYLKPAAELRRTTWIEGFVDAARFDDARYVAERMGWVDRGRCTTPELLNEALAERFNGR